jgi:chromosome segregation ATPase
MIIIAGPGTDLRSASPVVQAQLDKRFSVYMSQMQCAGRVELLRPDRFADWGLQIMVKFREAQSLQALSARVQSGGERSVSTILYLMALQVRRARLLRACRS